MRCSTVSARPQHLLPEDAHEALDAEAICLGRVLRGAEGRPGVAQRRRVFDRSEALGRQLQSPMQSPSVDSASADGALKESPFPRLKPAPTEKN